MKYVATGFSKQVGGRPSVGDSGVGGRGGLKRGRKVGEKSGRAGVLWGWSPHAT